MNVHLLPLMMSGATEQAEAGLTGGQIVFQVGVVFFIVLLNAFFVAAEFALVKVRGSQVEAAVEDGKPGARLVKNITQHLDGYMSASQLGITLCSIALGMVGEPLVAKIVQPLLLKAGVTSEVVIHGISLTIAYAIVTYLHVVLGELTPRSLAIRKALPTALLTARPLHFCYSLMRPGIWVLHGSARFLLKRIFRTDSASEVELAHSEEELRHIVSESEKSNRVTETEKDILLNALALNDLCVRDVMTPRNQVVSLDLDESFEANLKTAIESKHTRFPLVEGHLDHALGMVHIKDLLPLIGQPKPDLRKVKREIVPVPELMAIDKLLRIFLEKHLHFALVVDEFGGAVGVVTFDNVVEEIVGDIQDEFDHDKPEFRRLGSDEFEVDGTLNLYELVEHAGLTVESDEVTTVGGYVTHLLGHLPKPGERVEIGDYLATVTKSDHRRVYAVNFRRVTKPRSDEADASAAGEGATQE